VINGLNKNVLAKPEYDLNVAVTKKEQTQLSYKLIPYETVSAPISKGQKLGICKMYAAGREVGQVNLLATSSVAKKSPLLTRIKLTLFKVLVFIFKTFLVLFGIAFLIRTVNLRRQRK
jgi:D-alanyl-D-alanine carboxypeptidase